LIDLTVGHVISPSTKLAYNVAKVKTLYDDKMAKYNSSFELTGREARAKFLPATMDSAGRLGEEFEEYLRKLASDSKGKRKSFFNDIVSTMMLVLARDNNRRITRYELECEEVRRLRRVENEARERSEKRKEEEDNGREEEEEEEKATMTMTTSSGNGNGRGTTRVSESEREEAISTPGIGAKRKGLISSPTG
jgi:hypothetical protein